MKLFFITGENSGDSLAAPLIEALKEQYGDDVECLGIGGPLMKAAGFDELLPLDQISVIGIWEVIPKIPRLLKLNKSIVEEIEKQKPDAVITVDFPDFNFILAKSLKKRGIYKGKIIHYVAPSVWAWRPGRAKKIAGFMDGMMCLFPMEVEYFTKHGMKAAHVGHPLVMSNSRDATGDEFRKENNIKEDAKTIGLFFGSREREFKNLSAAIKEAALLVNDIETGIHIIAPTLPDLEYNVQKLLEDFKLPIYVVANPKMKWEAIKACDVAIAVSGTMGLELAYAGVPHVIAYKINPITALILRVLVKVKYAHLANILLDKGIVPECLQGKCTSNNIAQEALDLLQDEEKRNLQKESFLALGEILGDKNAMSPSQRAAEFIAATIKS
ncbi:MAG: lipid-A-disaccharide synthase [Alphaproteobacteria bacterium]|nr:MAG: lipid-A-disaccharide synthase [Alphaproteobacteria bacterium]